jgi:hypothetical protein
MIQGRVNGLGCLEPRMGLWKKQGEGSRAWVVAEWQ